jgi:hypothetical protein
MTMSSQELVLQFFESWKSTGSIDRAFFSDDFVFQGPSPRDDTEVWLSNSDMELPWDGVKILKLVSTDSNTALLFEGIDPVTLLNYRICWIFSVNSGKITEVFEVAQHM